jgi:predicted enzyme related to lactoylglutathione lyase
VTDELFPILSTSDIDRALRFYCDVLGCRMTYRFPSVGEIQYVGLSIGASGLGIGLDPEVVLGPRPRPMGIWVYVDNCDAVIERARAAGSTIVEEPSTRPWGERVARVSDPDGNDVLIGERSAGRPNPLRTARLPSAGDVEDGGN